MPSVCAVRECNSVFIKGGPIHFHTFPKDETLRRQWIVFCRRKDYFNPANAYICSRHFEATAYQRNLKYELLNLPIPPRQIRFEPGAVPTLHFPASEDNSASTPSINGGDIVFLKGNTVAATNPSYEIDDEKRIKEAEKVKRARLKPKAKKGEHAAVPKPEPLSEPEVEEDAGVGEALLPIVKVELPDLDSSVAAGINQDYDNGNFVEIKEEPIDVKTEPLDDMQIGEKLSAEAPSAKKSRSSFEEFCYKSDCNLEKSLGVIEDNKSNIIYIKEGCIKSEYGVDND